MSNKISIERLQRESEVEQEIFSRPVPTKKRSTGLDVAAGLVSFVMPGVGHVIKGKGLTGAVWFFSAISLVVLTLLWPLFAIALALLVLSSVVSAATADPVEN